MSPHSNSVSPDIAVSELQKHLQDAIVPITDNVHVNLTDGLHRILGKDLTAGADVPGFDNAAMDGFAFCAHDLITHPELMIVGQSYAGHPFTGQLQAGQAIRIMTGAPIPERADSVLPQELAIMKTATMLDMTNIAVKPGQHRRLRGEDIAAGSKVMNKGRRLTAADLGVLTSLGFSTIPVRRKLRVAIFSTGDELRDPGQSLDHGGIYDSNRIILRSLLTQFGADVLDLGVLEDRQETIAAALQQASHQVDAMITSGGISTGAADFTKTVMQQLGHIRFWSVNMRPGRPFAFGSIAKNHQTEKTYLFGLPGNPVAMLVSFYFFVRPALQLLSGSSINAAPQICATAEHAIGKKTGRTEFQRGIYQCDAQGNLRVRLTGDQGSGILSSMTHANCLIVLDQEQGNIQVGDPVRIILFEGLN